MQTAVNDIDSYIASFPEEVQQKLQELRQLIHETVPGLEETISYKIATFNLHGKYLVYFAGYKKHIGFYPFPSGIAEFKDEVKGYKTSKGTIQFPLDEPLPHDLIKRILKFRVGEVMQKLADDRKY